MAPPDVGCFLPYRCQVNHDWDPPDATAAKISGACDCCTVCLSTPATAPADLGWE